MKIQTLSRVSCGVFSLMLAGSVLANDEIVTMDEFEVTAFQRNYTAPVTTTGLGINADLFNTPLTVMSIPMDILDDQQVNNVEDALRNVSGVSKFKQGNGGEEKFSIRGFDASQSLFKDGARINNPFNATNIATTETGNIERYDVLKGPAAILYGSGEPGGIINYITKKPLFDRTHRSVELIAGSYDYYRGELDLAAPLGTGFAYRLVSTLEDSGSHRDHTYRDRWLLAPSIGWQPSQNTTLVLQYEYITDTYTQDRGQVLDGDAISGYYYSSRQDNSQFYSLPDWNELSNSEFHRWGLLLDHQFSNDATLQIRASATRVDKVLYDSSPNFINSSTGQVINSAGDMTIRPRFQGGAGDSDSLSAQYQHLIQGERLTHKIMIGADYEKINNDGFRSDAYDNQGNRIRSVGYNIFNRQYSGIPTGGLIEGPRVQGVQTDTHQTGFIVQDLISIGDTWHLLAGLRYTEFDNRVAGVRSDNISPRTGIVYRPRPELSYYASWSQGFTPTTATGFNPANGTGIDGPVLDPETSEQFEFGLRWASAKEAIVFNAALFDLSKDGIATTDPASLLLPPTDQWSANLGSTRTLGFDTQLVGRVGESLRLIAGYAYLDNELVKVDPAFASQTGNRLPGIPLHSANIWGVYEFTQGRVNGLGIGLGAFLQSKTFISTENNATYGAWSQIDAMVYYKRDRWKLQLNLKNLTDEQYNLAQAGTTSDSFAAVRVGTSSPLSITGSLAFEF